MPSNTLAFAEAPIDHHALRDQVLGERMRQYMTRQRFTAANGPLASAYLVWVLWSAADHRWLVGWWVLLLLVDSCTVIHTSLYLSGRQLRTPADMLRWRESQIALQGLAGLVWGSQVLLIGPLPQAEVDSAMVLVVVNTIAVIAMLPFRKAVIVWTLCIWIIPLGTLLIEPSERHLRMAVGAGVLLVSLNFYLWKASAQLVEGIEKRFEASALAMALHSAANRIRELATRDDLTGVLNRRQGMKLLADWQASVAGGQRRAQGSLGELGLLLLDVDFFKRVNDNHGHPAGDEVLREVSRRLQQGLRDSDVLARVGGEEFMVLLPHTPAAGAVQLAERLRLAVAQTPVNLGSRALDITVSIGVAQLVGGEPFEPVIAQADAALYAAKHGGRNRVVTASS